MIGDDPRRRQLARQRFAAVAQVKALTDRLHETDARRHPRAVDVLRQSVREATSRLEQIEAELAGGEAVVLDRRNDDAQEARTVMRNRLQHLLVALSRHCPPSCEDVAAELTRKIEDELKRLDIERRRA